FGPEYLQRWSLDMTRMNSLSFVFFEHLEYAAWKALVLPEDTQLYPLIQSDLEKTSKVTRVMSFLRGGDQKTRESVCQILRQRSLEALQ
ncbi:MAG: hypothetical protein K2X47_02060, partial [Bdellovibrionales bacterium]|nr:hypothetical protein [Bdellovibrionales bacterium]